MQDAASLFKRFAKYDQLYERGIITPHEYAWTFIDFLLIAPDDDSCLQLCRRIPASYRIAVLDLLDDLETTNFYRRPFRIGDSRTEEQIHAANLSQQELLQRLVPRLKESLLSASC